jgi:hypothetical protein
MATIYSSDLKLSIMATGENAGTWGQITNTNLYLLQQAIGGYEAISIAGGAQTTALTMSNGAISNARNAVIKLTGTITGNQIVTVPTGIEKTYIISNGTTGAFTVEFKQAGGTGVTFAAADKSTKILFADGTNIVETGNTTPIITQINDTNVNEQIKFTTTASAVNEFTITNAATGNAPEISATGGDTNIDLKITPKGSGKINLDGIKFPNADGSSGQFLKTDGSGSLSFADSGLAWQSVVTTSTITVVAGRAYFINTTSNACTVTLPSGTPTAGAQVQLVDYAGTFDTNGCIINPNGNKLEGQTGSLALTGDREGVILTYIDSTQGWLATSGINEGTDALSPGPYSIDFLVVAGGGSGGKSTDVAEPTNGGGGGGGAGGFRTSTQTVNIGTAITVTVGDGGAGDGNNPGSNSSISGSGLTTITSAGGGNGGGNDAVAGGSGGGGSSNSTTGASGNTPSTSPSQGSAGGNGLVSYPTLVGGGGGGAGAVGGNGSAPFNGGNGGNGTASSITGSSVTYAGGGGGGSRNATGGVSAGGTGGTGGGGKGAQEQAPTAAVAGTANTGGGGGGNHLYASSASAAGGKGVVILSVPTASYSSTTTGSPTVTTSGSNTIMQFNGSGSYTA